MTLLFLFKSHYHPDVEMTTTRDRIQPWPDRRAPCYCWTTSEQAGLKETGVDSESTPGSSPPRVACALPIFASASSHLRAAYLGSTSLRWRSATVSAVGINRRCRAAPDSSATATVVSSLLHGCLCSVSCYYSTESRRTRLPRAIAMRFHLSRLMLPKRPPQLTASPAYLHRSTTSCRR